MLKVLCIVQGFNLNVINKEEISKISKNQYRRCADTLNIFILCTVQVMLKFHTVM